MDIVDKRLSGGTREVSLSSWSFLFAEAFQYCQQRVENAQDLEVKLGELGYSVGFRMSGLISSRDRPGNKRDTTIVNVLQFITSTCWRSIYGKETNSLQRSTQNENEYFIYENDPVPNTFISVPRELEGRLNCASFNAGLIRGILEANFFTAQVRAVTPPTENNKRTTVYVVKFDSSVLAREKQRK